MSDAFPYNIRYVGDCSASGHGYAMRGNLAVLQELGIGPEQIDILPWPIYRDVPEDWFYQRFLCARDRPLFKGQQHLNIINTHLPDVGRFWTAGWYNVVVAAWETSQLPSASFPCGGIGNAPVAEAINKCDEVWATTERVKTTLVAGGVTIPIYVIPHALQPQLLETPPKDVEPDFAPELHPYMGPEDLAHTTPVLFYYVGGWNARKNVRTLLEAYFNTGWTPIDPVELVIHSVAGSVDEQARQAHAFVTQSEFAALRDSLPNHLDAPIVRVLTEPKSYSWICKLHAANHVFITATRGEGFCLPAWEAAAVGNRVIVPAGALGVDVPGAVEVPTTRTRITPMPEAQGYELGQKWWDVDVDDLTQAFKTAFDDVRANGCYDAASAQLVRAMLAPDGEVAKLIEARLSAIKKVLDGSGW